MKSIYNIRLLLVVSIIFTSSFAGFSQVAKSTYFMETSKNRSLMNPALRPDQGYVGVPLLSHMFMDVRTNSLNLDNLTFDKGGPERVIFMNSLVSPAEFLSNMGNNNYANLDFNYSLLSAGWYSGDGFWNVDLGLRFHSDANAPKSLFELMKKGFSSEDMVEYDISKVSMTANAMVEMGVGHSRAFLDDYLHVGLKVKALLGVANLDLNGEKLNLTGGPEYWSAKSHVKLQASAPGISAKYKTTEEGDEVFDGFDYDESFKLAGFGMAFDLGGEYDLTHLSDHLGLDGAPAYILDRLKVSLALTDIGFINWSKNSSVSLQSRDTEVRIDPTLTLNDEDNNSLEDAFDEFLDDINKAVDLQEDKERSRRSSLGMNMNVGLEYEFWKDNMTAGFLSSTRFGRYYNMSEFTFSVNYRPCTWFATSLAYSFVHNAFDTFGLAVHLTPSKGINFFIATDYIPPHVNSDFIPTTSKAVNAQFGFTIPLGARR